MINLNSGINIQSLGQNITKNERIKFRKLIFFSFHTFSYINDDWHPYTSEGPFYAEFRGPGDFRYFYGEPVDDHKCSSWLYKNQWDQDSNYTDNFSVP